MHHPHCDPLTAALLQLLADQMRADSAPPEEARVIRQAIARHAAACVGLSDEAAARLQWKGGCVQVVFDLPLPKTASGVPRRE